MAQAGGAAAREPSREEILASIRRIIEDSDGARGPGSEEEGSSGNVTTMEAEPLQAEEPANEPAAPEIEAFRSEFTDASRQPAQQPALRPVELARPGEATVQTGSHFLNGSAAHGHEPGEREPVRREADGGSRAAIISESAGRQVAAAFEELNEAFMASRKRSYDEIAEELLRPMLQEWLDNNLPLLVERLVREEIERVARGGAPR